MKVFQGLFFPESVSVFGRPLIQFFVLFVGGYLGFGNKVSRWGEQSVFG